MLGGYNFSPAGGAGAEENKRGECEKEAGGFHLNEELWMLAAIQRWTGLESIRRRIIVSVSKKTSALRGERGNASSKLGAGAAAASTGCIVPRPVSTKDFS